MTPQPVARSVWHHGLCLAATRAAPGGLTLRGDHRGHVGGRWGCGAAGAEKEGLGEKGEVNLVILWYFMVVWWCFYGCLMVFECFWMFLSQGSGIWVVKSCWISISGAGDVQLLIHDPNWFILTLSITYCFNISLHVMYVYIYICI